MKKLLAALIATITLTANAFTITGAGASFPYPVYAKWAEAFKEATGNSVNYQSIGSSGGIKQIDRKTVDFGASDVARSQEELDKMGQIQFPMVMGGVVLIVNLEGVANNQIDLSIQQVADIFRGKITNWKELGQGLPDKSIVLVVRADGSGTTGVFTEHLANASADFKQDIGIGKSVKWKGDTIGGKGNAGVAAMVQRVEGSIGYVEYAYAKQVSMPTTKINNVVPSAEAFKSGKWILTAETFLIVYPNGENTKNVAEFVKLCYENDAMADALDYVPLSAEKKAASLKILSK